MLGLFLVANSPSVRPSIRQRQKGVETASIKDGELNFINLTRFRDFLVQFLIHPSFFICATYGCCQHCLGSILDKSKFTSKISYLLDRIMDRFPWIVKFKNCMIKSSLVGPDGPKATANKTGINLKVYILLVKKRNMVLIQLILIGFESTLKKGTPVQL